MSNKVDFMSNEKEGGDTVKNTIKILVVALTTLGFSTLGFAQATPATPAPEKKTEMKSEKPKSQQISGEITSVDAKAGDFAVKTKDKEVKLKAESKGTKGALEKLKVGDMVKVSYTEKDGKSIASSVKAEKSTAAKSDKATEKKSDMPTEKKPATK
jgi:hypothetical protein